MQARMQQGMLADQGQAFNSMFTRDETSNELVVTKCPYSEVLRAEGKPHLLAVCCCSQDASWCVRLAMVFRVTVVIFFRLSTLPSNPNLECVRTRNLLKPGMN
jgi:hypothetical protein